MESDVDNQRYTSMATPFTAAPIKRSSLCIS